MDTVQCSDLLLAADLMPKTSIFSFYRFHLLFWMSHLFQVTSDALDPINPSISDILTLGCWDDGTNESSTKCLMFQVLFF